MVIKKCLTCGKKFGTYKSRIKLGNGKYCSKKCSGKKTLFKKGQNQSINTQFIKNHNPWNKQEKITKKCLYCDKEFQTILSKKDKVFFCSITCVNKSRSGQPSWNKNKKLHYQIWNKGKKCPQFQGINHPMWKGEKVGYTGLHSWVRKELGSPNKCEYCGKDGLVGKKIHWANKNHTYKRNLEDWLRLCSSCHKEYDLVNGLSKH